MKIIEKAAGILFFTAWLLCGCTVEKVCDDPRAAGIFAVAVVVTLLCAKVIGGNHD